MNDDFFPRTSHTYDKVRFWVYALDRMGGGWVCAGNYNTEEEARKRRQEIRDGRAFAYSPQIRTLAVRCREEVIKDEIQEANDEE